MRILLASNPLVGHWLPRLPLARAAQAAGHEVVVAAGPNVAASVKTEIERLPDPSAVVEELPRRAG